MSNENEFIVDNNYVRIGITGGTFDPIHHGHLIIAEDIREKFNLNKVVFIPSGSPPHKDNNRVTSSEHRLNMVKRAISDNPFFEASTIEIDRGGYTYTVDTLQQLRSLYDENTKLYFIVGADVIMDLLTWRDYVRVFTLCEFIAAFRPGYNREGFENQIEMLREKFGAVIHPVETPLVDVSSTQIRQRISSNKSIKYLVPETVERYIIDNGLYV